MIMFARAHERNAIVEQNQSGARLAGETLFLAWRNAPLPTSSGFVKKSVVLFSEKEAGTFVFRKQIDSERAHS
jgi:hypothetical protein